MEHWAQKCDGAGVDPAEHVAVCKERDELKAELQKVIGELHEVKSERDAALADMKLMLDNCKACVHQNDAPKDCDCECSQCKNKCACADCHDGSRFEWQGVKEETK